MTQQLVADVRLGCIHGLAGMPNVLRGVEDAEGQAGEEIARAEQASHWAQSEARAVWQIEIMRNLNINLTGKSKSSSSSRLCMTRRYLQHSS